jgi:hypothetical protein
VIPLLTIQIYNNYLINCQNSFVFLNTTTRVKDGSENPFMKRSAIKDCNEQPDPKLRGGMTTQSAGTRPNYFPFLACDFVK